MASRASNQLCLVGVTLVATRYLGPTDFGVLALAMAFANLARTALYTGPFEYLIKAPELERSATDVLVSSVLVAATGVVVIALLALGISYIISTSIAYVMLMLAPSILISAFASWQEALVLRKGHLQSYYRATMVVEVAAALGAVAGLVFGLGLLALVVQAYLRAIALMCAYRVMATPPRFRSPDLTHVAAILKWSRARFGTVIVNFFANYSGDIILGVVLSPAATGLFRAGNRIVTAVADVFTQPASMLAMTSISARYANGLPPDGRWLSIFGGVAFIGIPTLAYVAILGNWLAPIALGPEWAAAGPVITIMALARMASIVSTVASTMLVSYDLQKKVFWIQLAGALLTTLLTVGMAVFGVLGAAAASGIVLVFSAAVLVMNASRLGPPSATEKRDVIVGVGVPLCGTIVGVFLGQLLANAVATTPAMQLGIATVCGAVSWSAACLAIRNPILRCVAGLLGTDAINPKTRKEVLVVQ